MFKIILLLVIFRPLCLTYIQLFIKNKRIDLKYIKSNEFDKLYSVYTYIISFCLVCFLMFLINHSIYKEIIIILLLFDFLIYLILNKKWKKLLDILIKVLVETIKLFVLIMELLKELFENIWKLIYKYQRYLKMILKIIIFLLFVFAFSTIYLYSISEFFGYPNGYFLNIVIQKIAKININTYIVQHIEDIGRIARDIVIGISGGCIVNFVNNKITTKKNLKRLTPLIESIDNFISKHYDWTQYKDSKSYNDFLNHIKSLYNSGYTILPDKNFYLLKCFQNNLISLEDNKNKILNINKEDLSEYNDNIRKYIDDNYRNLKYLHYNSKKFCGTSKNAYFEYGYKGSDFQEEHNILMYFLDQYILEKVLINKFWKLFFWKYRYFNDEYYARVET